MWYGLQSVLSCGMVYRVYCHVVWSTECVVMWYGLQSVLLDKLTQEKQLARLRNETAEHEHWHDRLAIQVKKKKSVLLWQR